MTVQATSKTYHYNFLRRVLQANGLFSAMSGLILTFAAGPVSSFLGLDMPFVLAAIGISLLFYAFGLFQTAARDPLNRQFVMMAIILDIAWVAGSALILFTPWISLTVSGWWDIAIVADIVAVFAALQYYGLRRK
jgi:hypothetical protein